MPAFQRLRTAAEGVRSKLHSLGPTEFDANEFWTLPIQCLVRANLITEFNRLYEVIGVQVPTPDDTEFMEQLSLDLLGVRLGEASALVERKRLSVRIELRHLQQLVTELEREQEQPSVTLKALLAKWIGPIPLKPVRTFLGSAVIEHAKLTVGAVIFALLGLIPLHFFPGAFHKVMTVWNRVVGDTARAHP